jgi:hypothetical protein
MIENTKISNLKDLKMFRLKFEFLKIDNFFAIVFLKSYPNYFNDYYLEINKTNILIAVKFWPVLNLYFYLKKNRF